MSQKCWLSDYSSKSENHKNKRKISECHWCNQEKNKRDRETRDSLNLISKCNNQYNKQHNIDILKIMKDSNLLHFLKNIIFKIYHNHFYSTNFIYRKKNLISTTFFWNKHFYFKISFDAFFHFSKYRELLNTADADNKNKQEKLNILADQIYKNKNF